jgi:hypothetical protein
MANADVVCLRLEQATVQTGGLGELETDGSWRGRILRWLADASDWRSSSR